MTTTCDDCGRPNPIAVDLADGAQLCPVCVAAYDQNFVHQRLRFLPATNPDPDPTIHRRQP